MKPICETREIRRNSLGYCCEKCQGCAFWFMQDLRQSGFKGIIFGVGDKAIEL